MLYVCVRPIATDRMVNCVVSELWYTDEIFLLLSLLSKNDFFLDVLRGHPKIPDTEPLSDGYVAVVDVY